MISWFLWVQKLSWIIVAPGLRWEDKSSYHRLSQSQAGGRYRGLFDGLRVAAKLTSMVFHMNKLSTRQLQRVPSEWANLRGALTAEANHFITFSRKHHCILLLLETNHEVSQHTTRAENTNANYQQMSSLEEFIDCLQHCYFQLC